MRGELDKSLPLPQEAAFALFTERVSEWWPPDRRHTGDPTSQLFLEAAGRFFERAANGHEVDLGRVRIWEPPRRLVLDFYVGTDAAHPTEVEVTFEPEAGGTRVRIRHRPLPGSEPFWGARAPRYDVSWDKVLAGLSSVTKM